MLLRDKKSNKNIEKFNKYLFDQLNEMIVIKNHMLREIKLQK